MIGDLQPGEVVIAEKIDRISRLPLPEAERLRGLDTGQRRKPGRPPAWSIYPTWRPRPRASPRSCWKPCRSCFFARPLQMARDDYEDRARTPAQGIELARRAGRYRSRRADPKRRAQVVALRKSGYSVTRPPSRFKANLQCSPVKTDMAEVSQPKRSSSAVVEDALTEADATALSADERREERA